MADNYDSKTNLEQATATSFQPSEASSSTAQPPDHRDTTPPPYSSSTSHISEPPVPSLSTSTPRIYPGLPHLDYAQYLDPNFKSHSSGWLSPSDGSIITDHELYSRSPEALKRLIKTQASLPPKPVIRVQGTRGGRTDFDLKMNLMACFVRGDEESQWNYLEIVPIEGGESSSRSRRKQKEPPADQLDDVAKRFCKDHVTSRQLIITREITNLDLELLEGRIHALISRLSYPGQVTITLHLHHSKITIQPPQKPFSFSSINNMFRSTKKYEVKVVWPFADLGPQVQGGGSGGRDEGRRFAVQSEEEWWRDWRDAVKSAVLGRRKGWVTSEDRLEWLMGMRSGEGEGLWSDS